MGGAIPPSHFGKQKSEEKICRKCVDPFPLWEQKGNLPLVPGTATAKFYKTKRIRPIMPLITDLKHLCHSSSCLCMQNSIIYVHTWSEGLCNCALTLPLDEWPTAIADVACKALL